MFGWSAAWAGVVAEIDDAEGRPGDDPDLVILYSSEQEGRVGPCGCSDTPRGGLAALSTAAQAIRAEAPPSLVVNAGAWLASADPLADPRNLQLHRALSEVEFDVLHATFRDLPAAGLAPHPGLVSASHRGSELPVGRYKRFDLGGLDVVVTGVSKGGLEHLQPAGTVVEPAVAAVRAVVEDADPEVMVVLVYDLPREVPAIVAIPGVDVVIEAGGWSERWPPRAEGGAVWVRSRADGLALGELRLWLEDGRLVRAVDRVLPLGPEVPPDPWVTRLQ